MSERFAAVASRAQRLDGFAQTLEPVSTAGRYKVMMDIADNTVKITQNGGAWTALSGGGGGGSLDAAYLLGNQINLTQAAGAVILSSARTSGNILQIATTNAPATVTSAVTGISIDMSSLGTAATKGTVNFPAISIVGPRSSVAKARGSGLIQMLSSYRNASAFSLLVRNKQALAGSIVQVGWDSEDYDGTPATASVLDDTTHVVTIDGVTNVDAFTNNVPFTGIVVSMPSTNDVSARAAHFQSVASWAHGGIRQGRVVFVEDNTPVTGAGTDNRYSVYIQRNVTAGVGGNVTINGSALRVENSSSIIGGLVSDASRAFHLYHAPYNGGADSRSIYCLTSQTNGTAFELTYFVVTPSGDSVGFYLDAQSSVAASAQKFIGAVIATPDTSHVGSASVRLTGVNNSVGLEFDDGQSLAVSAANEGRIRYNAATQVFQVSLNGAAYVNIATGASGVTLDGAYDFGGAGVGRTITSDAGAVVITSAAADNNGVLELTKAPAGAQTGSVFAINATPGASAAMIGQTTTMGANTSATGAAHKIVWSSRNGNTNGVIDVGLNVTSPTTAATTFIKVRSLAAWAGETGALTGISVDLGTNVANSSTNPIIGGYFSIGNNNNASDVALSAYSQQLQGPALASTLSPIFASTANAAQFYIGPNVTTSALGNGSALWCREASATGRGIYVATETFTGAHTAGYLLCVRRAGTWSGGGTESVPLTEVARVESITASAAISGTLLAVYNGPTNTVGTLTQSGYDVTITRAHQRSSGTVNLSGALLGLIHSPSSASTDTSSLIYGSSTMKTGTMLDFNASGVVTSSLTLLSLNAGLLTGSAVDVTGVYTRLVLGSSASMSFYADDQNQGAPSGGTYSRSVYVNLTGSGNGRTAFAGMNKSAAVNANTYPLLYMADGLNSDATNITMGTGTRPVFLAEFKRGGSWGAGTTNTSATAAVQISDVRTTASTGTLALSGGLLSLSSTPANPAGTATFSSTLLSVLHAPTGTITDTTTGFRVTMTPATSNAVVGQSTTMSTNTSSSGAGANFIWNSAAGTDGIAAGGVVNVYTNANINSAKLTLLSLRANAASTLTISNTTTGAIVDLSNNVTHGAFTVYGVRVLMGASSDASTAGFVVISTQTGSDSAGSVITMSPGSSASVIGQKITMGANASGPAVSITHNGSGTNANQIVFTNQADGTGAHLYGPTSGDFIVKAGQPTGTANGKNISVNASAGSTTGTGGSIYLNAGDAVTAAAAQAGGDIELLPGAGAGGGSRGTLLLCGNTSDRLGFFGASPGTTKQTVGGSRADPEQSLAFLLSALDSYGLITDSSTP